jgi:hypothetical protein
MVAARLGSRASNVCEQDTGVGTAWLGSLSAGLTTRSVDCLGRLAGTTAVAKTPGRFECEQACQNATVSRAGENLKIFDPIDLDRVNRCDRAFATKEAVCGADPDLWEPWRGNPPGRPGYGEKTVRKSERLAVCAGQCLDPEGSSPSAARMRGGVSKDGGNISSAGERDHGEPYTGTKLETTDTAKGMHLQSGFVRKDNQRAGCPPRGGIRKACGELPGRNRGGPPP